MSENLQCNGILSEEYDLIFDCALQLIFSHKTNVSPKITVFVIDLIELKVINKSGVTNMLNYDVGLNVSLFTLTGLGDHQILHKNLHLLYI